MSQEKKNIRIQSRIDSKANWEEKNPTLLDREIGYEEETGRYKFGAIDEMGEEMHWNDLPYASSSGLSPEFDDTSEIFNTQGENSAGQMGYFIRSIDFDNHKIYLSNIQYPLPDVSSVDYTDSEFETPAYEIGDSFNLILKTFENKREHYHFISNIIEIYNNVVVYDTALPFSEIYEETSAEYGQSFFVSKKPNVGTYNLGGFSHAEGQMTYASGGWSHSEGFGGIAAGMFSHAEGREGRAAYAAHAEGYICDALGNHSHAEGNLTQALGNNAHSEGKLTEAQALSSHAEGEETKARSSYSHAEGRYSSTDGEASHAEGQGTNASGSTAHSEGQSTKAQGAASHAEGWGTIAIGKGAHSEGGKDNDLKIDSTTASGNYSHAEGLGSVASGMAAHSEGRQTTASGNFSHAEGINAIASAPYSHAENKAKATQEGSHAEGSSTAAGVYGHAEGESTTAYGKGAHSEGKQSIANGAGSHAEGYSTEARGSYSHAEGRGTIATGQYQHVQGRFNKIDDTVTNSNLMGTYAHIIGNGTDTATAKRKNIYTLDWEGNAEFAGGITANNDVVAKINNSQYSLIDTVLKTSDLENNLYSHCWQTIEYDAYIVTDNQDLIFSNIDIDTYYVYNIELNQIHIDYKTKKFVVPHTARKIRISDTLLLSDFTHQYIMVNEMDDKFYEIIPEQTNIYTYDRPIGTSFELVCEISQLNAHYIDHINETVRYIYSTNPNQYPNNDYIDNIYYKYTGIPYENARDLNLKITNTPKAIDISKGGKLQYIGMQDIPQEEIAFIPPEGETYLGQLPEALGGWYITYKFENKTYTISKYNFDKTLMYTQNIVFAQTPNPSIILNENNGEIFVSIFNASYSSYKYGRILVYNYGDSTLESNLITSGIPMLDLKIQGPEEGTVSLGSPIILNNKVYYLFKGTSKTSYTYYSYVVCETQYNNETGQREIIADYIRDTAYSPKFYTNNTDLYLYKEYGSSDVTYSIIKYPNGNLHNPQTIWSHTYSSSYTITELYFLKESSTFMYELIYDRTYEQAQYFIINDNGNSYYLPSSQYQYILPIISTKNYNVFTISPNNATWTGYESKQVILSGKGLGLIDVSTGKIVFIDGLYSLTEIIRFDEDTAKFYISQGNGTELIYQIVQ